MTNYIDVMEDDFDYESRYIRVHSRRLSEKRIQIPDKANTDPFEGWTPDFFNTSFEVTY